MNDPLSRLDGTALDVLVLGGGLSGCLAAWELAGVGLRTALVERHDLGWGATGRWLRLLEGGLDPTLSGRWREARARVFERGRMVRAAPHMVRPCPVVLLGEAAAGRLASAWLELGPRLQARLGARREGWPGLRKVDRDTLRALAPQLAPGGEGPWLLDHDALTDGRRLVVLLALAARASGAEVLTRCEPVDLVPGPDKRVARVTLRDRLTGRLARVGTRLVVNATGAWIDVTRRWAAVDGADRPLLEPAWSEVVLLESPTVAAVRQLRWGRPERGFLAPSLDDHAVLHVPLRWEASRSFDPEGAPPDGRPPGRTETRLRQHLGAPTDRVRSSVPQALREGGRHAAWGRVVVEKAAGGWWIDLVPAHPTLRWWQARHVVRRALRLLGAAPADEGPRPIPGGDVTSIAGEEASARGRGLTPGLARWLVRRHGSRWIAVMRSYDGGPGPGGEETPLTGAELEWSFEEEGARTLADLFWRWRLPELFSADRRDEEWDVARRFAQHAARRWAWRDARLEAEWRRWQRERARVHRPDNAAEEAPR
jgi:glycerol-3-phosphate dehydrogenase